MTINEAKDKLSFNWRQLLRDTVMVFGSVGALVWLLANMVIYWPPARAVVAEMAGTPEIAESLSDVNLSLAVVAANIRDATARQAAMTERLAGVEAMQIQSGEPVAEIERAETDDGYIGQFVKMAMKVKRLRSDCGSPRIRASFHDGEGFFHHFTDVSGRDDTGRGVALPADNAFHTVFFSARIPPDRNVHAGRGNAEVVAWNYDDCETAPAVSSGLMPFTIHPRLPSDSTRFRMPLVGERVME